MTSSTPADFERYGFAGPFEVFSPDQCERIVGLVDSIGQQQPPSEWHKGHASTSSPLFRIATNPRILDHVQTMLGKDIMLWGATVVRRRPGQVHPWHTDIETSGSDLRTVSAWIGIRNTNEKSSLQLITSSHRFGKSIQEVAAQRGVPRWKTTGGRAFEWAQEMDPESKLVTPKLTNGQMILFDGRLWHGSENENNFGERLALLLQYASPDSPIRMPDLSKLDWPFRLIETPRPPCLVVRGSANSLNSSKPANNFSRPPVADPELPSISAWIRKLEVPLAENPKTGWKVHPIFRGSTPNLDRISCHASALAAETVPHPPHAHDDEELLIMLSGEATLVLKNDGEEEHHSVKRGQFAYYPAHQLHTLRASATQSANYVMFKWRNETEDAVPELECQVIDLEAYWPNDKESEFRTGRVFEGATNYLRRLQCHVTRLEVGAGYDAHIDAHDVAIVVLEGEVETDGQQVGKNGVIFFAAGTPHGMRNVGPNPARYLVFEFHRAGWIPPSRRTRYSRRLRKLVRRSRERGRQIGRDALRLLRQTRTRLVDN
ncbi:MAG: cupin domain-containing protein [Rhodothermia bacterium]|nr:cupin domain-containing protein [Rhodothermia bacterium]